MKRTTLIATALLLCSTALLQAQQKNTPSPIPSDALVESFITERANPKKPEETTRFSASIRTPKLSDADRLRYQKAGKVPYTLTLSFTMTTETIAEDGRRASRGTSMPQTTIYFVLVDEDGNVAKSLSGDRAKYTTYNDVVTKEGFYTAYIWTKYGNETYGHVQTIHLSLPSGDSDDSETGAPSRLPAKPATPSAQSPIPSDEFVASFITERVNPKTPTEVLRFSGYVSTPNLSDTERLKYQKSGKVPYTVRAGFSMSRERVIQGKVTRTSTTSASVIPATTINFVLVDDQGNVVKRVSGDRAKFQPYNDTVTKEGTYTYYVWTKHGSETYGNTFNVNLSLSQ